MVYARIGTRLARGFLLLSSAAAAALAACLPARADWVPTQPVRIVVPYAAGGGADIVVRRVGERAKDVLGQPVVVENRPGAGTAIGAMAVQNSAPDGHTLLLATSTTLAVNPNLQRRLTYAPEKFVPVAGLQSLPFMLNVSKDSPVKSLQELHAYAVAHPGRLNYGTLGQGSSNHVLGGLLGQRAAPGVMPIHYQSAGPAILALMRGDIHVYFDGISTSIPRLASGDLRGLAVTGKQRVRAAPAIPTVAEAGYPELGLTIWYGLVAPPGTPASIVQKLNSVFNQVLAQEAIVHSMQADGTEPLVLSPGQFGELIREDREVWGDAIRSLQIRLD
ncbi:MAG: tripartite tricarboxylate transporter substrate binding protein [Pigmentiphaga sp.]|uniref:Bug family tripartite tricarboxylate transporter substrate binding protein n=1 Tax=Pigmentiphaga sp. TaxID=1977564 RepID=UPI0029B0E5DA|nr:tripartite tricarboxylate transporter substrate binding protein [Pigmentiphaga sp.]MDX3906008.1 tripartite tricarboxylate transporter substrate binding protein [Pigmentiphaga sp.]